MLKLDRIQLLSAQRRKPLQARQRGELGTANLMIKANFSNETKKRLTETLVGNPNIANPWAYEIETAYDHVGERAVFVTLKLGERGCVLKPVEYRHALFLARDVLEADGIALPVYLRLAYDDRKVG
jgi:hypothetical protein